METQHYLRLLDNLKISIGHLRTFLKRCLGSIRRTGFHSIRGFAELFKTNYIQFVSERAIHMSLERLKQNGWYCTEKTSNCWIFKNPQLSDDQAEHVVTIQHLDNNIFMTAYTVKHTEGHLIEHKPLDMDYGLVWIFYELMYELHKGAWYEDAV